jgi:hypothetical protein
MDRNGTNFAIAIGGGNFLTQENDDWGDSSQGRINLFITLIANITPLFAGISLLPMLQQG